MPLYRYKSYTRRGDSISGTIDATSVQGAKEILRGQSLMPISIEEVRSDSQNSILALFQRKVSVRDKLLFTKQLGVLLAAGIPLLKAIVLLIDQFEGKMQRILIDIKDLLKEGISFGAALERYPSEFDHIYTQLVKAGEASGKLEIILSRLVVYMEKSEETKKKIQGAMAYPIFLFCATIGIVVGVLLFLMPGMASMFTSSGAVLPAPTQIMMDMSDALTGSWHWILAVLLIGGTGFFVWQGTDQGKYTIDKIILKTPGFAFFAKTKAVVQFCKTLGMLLESGVSLPEALNIVCNIVDNNVLKKRLNDARESIIKEGKLAKYLKDTQMFPPIASYMISTGEESGDLAGMLTTVGNDYEIELEEITNNLVGAINPVMMMFLMAVVLFTVLAIFLPILEMGNAVQF